MSRLKTLLWCIVCLYIVYAIYRDGLSGSILLLLGLVVFTGAMQCWLHSHVRKKLREQHDDPSSKANK
jgi:hypothetical protein